MALNPSQNAQDLPLEGGTYDILRSRLANHRQDLQQRLARLQEARKQAFGTIELKLLANDRISTENNCIPRDMIGIAHLFIFGYNVHLGLRTEIEIADVFSVYEYHQESHSFSAKDLTLLQDKSFESHLKELYKFYKEAAFAEFIVRGPHLYMVFQVGKKVEDIKAFKWLIDKNTLRYLDNRGEHEVKHPAQHEFVWKRATRDVQRKGRFPHLSILDRVFVETVGGNLTIKIEDNTDTGEGIYTEPVDNKDQSLDDAEFSYADLGNLILLRIKPYQEPQYRYFVFNDKLKQVQRIDKIEEACILLPDAQGLIFSNGYYLQNGDLKVFDNLIEHLRFEKKIVAPNGEDFLYVFHNDYDGVYVLFAYNLIAQKVDSPIVCNGFSLFAQGELVYFRKSTEPSKNHQLQIWQSPFVSPDYVSPTPNDSFLHKIGNKDLVRGMAECSEVLNLLAKEQVYATLYQDLVQKCTSILDFYYWINHPETFEMHLPLREIKQTAMATIDEFEKVQSLQKNTAQQIAEVQQKVKQSIENIKRTIFDSVEKFVDNLSLLRTLRGECIALKDLRYTQPEAIAAMEAQIIEQSSRLSEACANFLSQENALDYYHLQAQKEEENLDKSSNTAQIGQVESAIEALGQSLDLLIEVVGNLKIEDPTQSTLIIDRITGIYATLNQLKAVAKNKKKRLQSVEAKATFTAQMKLLAQALTNYLDIADEPAKCEEYLTKMMIQMEEMEGKFADFDEFLQVLSDKREEVYNAFESKKIALQEARNRRANNLMQAAERMLKGIAGKAASLKSTVEINAYFASDLMVEKLRDSIQKLQEIGDTVKADELQSRLKSLREESARQLKDRQEMFVEGTNIVKMGRHQFSVSTNNLELTILLRQQALYFHLTGTNFFEKIEDKALETARSVWEQELVSENAQVYRAEYLAYKVYEAAGNRSTRMQSDAQALQYRSIGELAALSDEALLEYVQRFASTRYQEGYVKGLHEADATLILKALVQLHQQIDLLRYPTAARAAAQYYWRAVLSEAEKQLLHHQLKSIGMIMQVFPRNKEFGAVIGDLQGQLSRFCQQSRLFPDSVGALAGEYLFYEITRGERFVISQEAARLYQDFKKYLQQKKAEESFYTSVEKLHERPQERFELIQTWLRAFLSQEQQLAEAISFVEEFIDEATCLIAFEAYEKDLVQKSSLQQKLSGFKGSHPLVENKEYLLHYNDFILKLSHFEQIVVPLFRQFTESKKKLSDEYRERLRLEEFRPRVLSSFVRNKLIDQVYLPLIGDNLAKQIGVVGENKRTDLMGMLLLISPPGYGKTTLMEYVSSRLGLIFMKINGPAIGHRVTSLDPAEAPNASAREELNKLNLAFEMGDNVMIYVDDIQHCHPEFLQKFISLCDGQRKIEGVYQQKPKTYDLRGRKVCVVMAGNPYTESGDKFQIPDMLANRADTYNLGDIIGDTEAVFKLSYIENCLTSNPTLQKIASKSSKDMYELIRVAENDSREGLALEANYSSEEVNEAVSVLQKLFVIRDFVLKNNQQYILSAAQSDEFRTEPPFKLQGSYRNMNKMAEKVLPIMNEEELLGLIFTHYENEAQTLTTGTEANLLKFKELNNLLSPQEAARWQEIKETFRRNNRFKGLGGQDQSGQMLAQLSALGEGLEKIHGSIEKGIGEKLKK